MNSKLCLSALTQINVKCPHLNIYTMESKLCLSALTQINVKCHSLHIYNIVRNGKLGVSIQLVIGWLYIELLGIKFDVNKYVFSVRIHGVRWWLLA